jgi:hypothetical protein
MSSNAIALNSGRAREPILLPVDDTTPLIRVPNRLARAIYERCIEDADTIDRYPCGRRTALGASIIASLGANASYIPISLKLPVGPLFAIANFVGFFKLDIWAIRGTINDELGPKGEHEIVLLQRGARGKCYTIAVLASSLVVALLSQIPVALPALDYNGSLAIPSVVFLFVGGALIPIRSLQLSVNKAARLRNSGLGDVSRKVEELRLVMSSLIDQHREIFRKMGYERQLEFIESLRQFEGAELEQTHAFALSILNPPLEDEEVPSRPISDYVAMGAGVVIALSLEAGLAYYTFEKSKLNIIDNSFVAVGFAASVVASSFYLAGRSIISMAQRMVGSLLNLLTCRIEKAIAHQLRPKMTIALKLLGMAIDLGALGATIVIWGDFLKDNLPAKLYFEITLCMAYFLFLSTATLDMIDEVIEESILNSDNKNERAIVQLNNRLKQFQSLIENSSLLDFGLFVAKLPAELKQKLLQRVNLSIEKLDGALLLSTLPQNIEL